MAKELVRLRAQQNKMQGMKSNLTAIGVRTHVSGEYTNKIKIYIRLE